MPERRWFADKDSRSISAKVSAAMPVEYGRQPGRLRDGGRRKARQGMSRYFLPLTDALDALHHDRQRPASVLAAVRRGSTRGHAARCHRRARFHLGPARQDSAPAKRSAPATRKSNSGRRRRSTGSRARDQGHQCDRSRAIEHAAWLSTTNTSSRSSAGSRRAFTRKSRWAASSPTWRISRMLRRCSAPSSWWRAKTAARSRPCMPSSKTKAMPGASPAPRLTGSIEEQRLLPDEVAAETSEMTSMLQRMRQIGRRTAEMHLALASHDVDGFAPEPIAAEDSARWSEAIAARAARVFESCSQRRTRLAGARSGAGAAPARPARSDFRAYRQPQGRALNRRQDPPSRRFPSWPDADCQG